MKGRQEILQCEETSNEKSDVRSRVAQEMVRYCLTACAVFGLISAVFAGPPPPSWYQVNQDGFVSGLGPSSGGTLLFVFNEDLYAFNNDGLFQMNDPITRDWPQLVLPSPPAGPGATPSTLIPFGDYLYAWDNGQLWWIAKGLDLTGPNWNKVTSVGLPGSVSPTPRILFKDQIYAYYFFWQGSDKIFQIWRSMDVGKAVMNWQVVVTGSFGDPSNNRDLDIMPVFNDHIYAGTNTLEFVFGAPQGKDDGGVEIWESPSGDLGSWTQVNVDGFGTFIPYPGDPSKKLFTNHVLGSWTVYGTHLYISTKSHWGAEVWRYNGTGLGGWVNVTPPWAGPDIFFPSNTKRFESIAVFQNSIYVAEGFPSANLAEYDGQDWSVVVDGPNPFDPGNTMLASLAVLEDKLYVSAGWPAGTSGDQVWEFPFNQPPVAVCQDMTVSAGPECTADASIDNGSFDPDGDPMTLTQNPAGPYGLGDTLVTLTVTDDRGASDTCQAVVTVVDLTPPRMACNSPGTMTPPDAPIYFVARVTDNCDENVFVEITGYDCFFLTRNGKRIDKTESCMVEVDGDTITILDSGGVGDHITWSVRAVDDSGNESTLECEVEVVNPKGDVNKDGTVDIADVAILCAKLYTEGNVEIDPLLADTNEDGAVDLADAIWLLDELF